MRNNWQTGDSQVIADEQHHSQVSCPRTLLFVMSALKPLCCACSLRMMLLGPETQEGERFDLGVQSQVQRYHICSSRVYQHASHMDALA